MANRSVRSGKWRVATTAFNMSVSLWALAPTSIMAAPTVESDLLLGDIVVTATRRPERVDDVPLSVIAKDRQTLDRDHIETFTELAHSTPGLAERGAFGGTTKISIRGIASNVGAATTGVYIDDTPIHVRTLGAAGVYDSVYPDLFDLARVEVLRGPQGTLFGEGSEGGTIRFITPDPDLRDAQTYGKGFAATTKGGAPSWFIGDSVSIPLSLNRAALRASVSWRRDGGWIDRVPYTGVGIPSHNANLSDTVTARAALKLALTSNLSIQPSLYLNIRKKADTDQYWTSLSMTQQDRFINGQPLAQPIAEQFLLTVIKITQNLGALELLSSTSWFERKSSFQVDYTTHLLEGLTRGQLSTLPGVPGYAVSSHFHSNQSSFVEELRLSSNKPKHSDAWVVGLHYATERQRIDQSIVDPLLSTFTATIFGCVPLQCFGEDLLPGNASYRALDRSRDRHISAFASADWILADRITLTTGIRGEHTVSTFSNAQDGAFNFGSSGGTTRLVGAQVTPRLALRYRLNNDGILFASVARGARPGGGNTGVPAAFCATDLASLGVPLSKDYKGDHLWTYELGAKQHLGNARFESNLFTTRWTGIQQSIPLANCGFAFTTNLGSAISRGFDLHLSGNLLSGLSVDGSLAYTDAHYTRDVRFGSGVVLVGSGDPLPSPPWQLRLSSRYERPFADKKISVQVDYDHSSPYKALPSAPAFSADPAIDHAAATNLVGARLTLASMKWRMSFFIENLLNSTDRLFRTRDSPFERTIRDVTFRPRTFGVELTMNVHEVSAQ